MKLNISLPTFLINKILRQSYYSNLQPADTIKYALVNKANSKRAKKQIYHKYTYYGPKNQLNFDLPDEFAERLQKSADEANLSLNDYIVWMLRKWKPEHRLHFLEKRKAKVEQQIKEYKKLKSLIQKEGN